MNTDEIKREKLIRFIKSNNPFYMFSSFDGYTMEQLGEIKMSIEQEIKSTHIKNKQKKNNALVIK